MVDRLPVSALGCSEFPCRRPDLKVSYAKIIIYSLLYLDGKFSALWRLPFSAARPSNLGRMEGMDSSQASTDEGSTSSRKPTEGLIADSGRSKGSLTSLDRLLDSPTASMALRAEEGQFEPVTPPTPRNPLAALAVYVDINFPSAIQMLRTAASAAVEEVTATLSFRSSGRLSITKRLHQRIEELWIRPCRQLNEANFDNIRLLIGSLQQQHHRCGLATPTTASSSTEAQTVDHNFEDVAHRCMDTEDTSGLCGSSASLNNCVSSDGGPFRADSPPAMWRPLRRDDGTFIAPPVELLAAFADAKIMKMPHLKQRYFTYGGQDIWPSPQKATPHSTKGCVVGLCVRSLLGLYIQAIRSLQPSLLPNRSVVLVTAVNVPMMFRVLEEHHLIVQPLDLDPHTLMPTKQSLQQAVQCWGSRVKAILCSHLYGGLCDLQPLVDFSAKHKLLLIEDCAESFVGELYRGQWQVNCSSYHRSRSGWISPLEMWLHYVA